MPKAANSTKSLPASSQDALKRLGENLQLARLRRKESLRDWALRVEVSVPTLMRMEKGDPKVGIGAYASALWLIGLDKGLGDIALPSKDNEVLHQEISTLLGKRARGAHVQ